MEKALNLAKKIREDFEKNWLDELTDYDLCDTFKSIYTINSDISTLNKIVCYVIYAYDPDSLWLDLKKDRIENKQRILSNLGIDLNSNTVKEIISNQTEELNISVFNYLERLKTWKWHSVFDLLDSASKMARRASKDISGQIKYDERNKEGEIETLTEELDIDKVLKAEKTNGELIALSIQQRRKADELIMEIKKDFVNTDNATQADFGFNFTDTSKKKDIMSHREWVRERNEKRKQLSA